MEASSFIRGTGTIGLNILHPSNAIYTKLNNNLSYGQVYSISVKLKIMKLFLNSDVPGEKKDFNDQLIDSLHLDYNHIIGVITMFHDTLPQCSLEGNNQLIFLDFPEEITPEFSDWITISTTYQASGCEKYFSIGTCDSREYIRILERIKPDNLNYKNKWAFYWISNVSVIPIYEDKITDICIYNTFHPDLLNDGNRYEKFIIRNINFDFDCYYINTTARIELLKLTTYLNSKSDYTLKITGHTDSTGSAVFNQKLSENRARAIYLHLISLGVDPSRLTWEGRGENEPLQGELFLKNLELHRRVEFELIWNY